MATAGSHNSPVKAAIPFALTMAGAVTGLLVGVVLLEASDAHGGYDGALLWVSSTVGVGFGLAISLSRRIALVEHVCRLMGANSLSLIAFNALFGLLVGLASFAACATFAAWPLSWNELRIGLAISPICGALTAIGALVGGIDNAR